MTRSTRNRLAVVSIAASLLLASCTNATSESTFEVTTTLDPVVAQYEADVQLINDLWSGEMLAYEQGFEQGVQYWVDNNYPPMGCTYDAYVASWYPEGPIDGLAVQHVASGPTIARDDGWVIPGGTLRGHEAEGRIYVMSVRVTRTNPNVDQGPAVDRDLHVTVLDGDAHFFIGCSA